MGSFSPQFFPQKQEVWSDYSLQLADLNNWNTKTWKETLLRRMYEKNSAACIQKIPIPYFPIADDWNWTDSEHRNFSSEAIYQLVIKKKNYQSQMLSDEDLQLFSKLKIHRRLKILSQRATVDLLPTRCPLSEKICNER